MSLLVKSTWTSNRVANPPTDTAVPHHHTVTACRLFVPSSVGAGTTTTSTTKFPTSSAPTAAQAMRTSTVVEITPLVSGRQHEDTRACMAQGSACKVLSRSFLFGTFNKIWNQKFRQSVQCHRHEVALDLRCWFVVTIWAYHLRFPWSVERGIIMPSPSRGWKYPKDAHPGSFGVIQGKPLEKSLAASMVTRPRLAAIVVVDSYHLIGMSHGKT